MLDFNCGTGIKIPHPASPTHAETSVGNRCIFVPQDHDRAWTNFTPELWRRASFQAKAETLGNCAWRPEPARLVQSPRQRIYKCE
jgi:hypothetical protein